MIEPASGSASSTPDVSRVASGASLSETPASPPFLPTPPAASPAKVRRQGSCSVTPANGVTPASSSGVTPHQRAPSPPDPLELVLRADDESGWRLLRRGSVRARTVELLEYAHVHDSLGWHVDEQSAVTALVMLSAPGDFAGAELQHEVDGEARATNLHGGDVAVYRSHQAHRVTPLRGSRERAAAGRVHTAARCLT